MLEAHTFFSLTTEQRVERRKERAFEEWAKQIKPGWTPKASELGATFKK